MSCGLACWLSVLVAAELGSHVVPDEPCVAPAVGRGTYDHLFKATCRVSPGNVNFFEVGLQSTLVITKLKGVGKPLRYTRTSLFPFQTQHFAPNLKLIEI